MRKNNFTRVLALFLAALMLFPTGSYAQVAITQEFALPAPGTMVNLSPAFNPMMIKGLKIDPQDALKIDFIVNPGDEKLTDQQFQESASRLVRYFFASLTVPENELWVNLSPAEKDRIIPNQLGVTELGVDLLSEDYLLKQITASLLYPDSKVGQKFWARIDSLDKANGIKETMARDTLNKVWIVPDRAEVYEKNGVVFVVDRHLKVMLQEDYLLTQGHAPIHSQVAKENNAAMTQVLREIVIPELEKEVNEGQNFARLRQICNAMILATWYKKNLRQSLLGQVYIDQNKVKGVDTEDQKKKLEIFDQYVAAFSKGAFNYIKEDTDAATQEILPKKYFSGGFEGLASSSLKVTHDLEPRVLANASSGAKDKDRLVSVVGLENGTKPNPNTLAVASAGVFQKAVVAATVAGQLCFGAGCATSDAPIANAPTALAGKSEADVSFKVIALLNDSAMQVARLEEVRETTAFKSLLKFGAQAVPGLVQFLKMPYDKTNPDARRWAVHLLGVLPDKESDYDLTIEVLNAIISSKADSFLVNEAKTALKMVDRKRADQNFIMIAEIDRFAQPYHNPQIAAEVLKRVKMIEPSERAGDLLNTKHTAIIKFGVSAIKPLLYIALGKGNKLDQDPLFGEDNLFLREWALALVTEILVNAYSHEMQTGKLELSDEYYAEIYHTMITLTQSSNRYSFFANSAKFYAQNVARAKAKVDDWRKSKRAARLGPFDGIQSYTQINPQEVGGLVRQDVGGPVRQDVGGPVRQDVGGPVRQDVGGPVRQDVGGLVRQDVGGPVRQDVGGPVRQDVGGPVRQDVGGPVRQDVGGIDLNPANLNLQIRRDGNGVALPVINQPFKDMKIDGFLPVIINITPVSTLELLGVHSPLLK